MAKKTETKTYAIPDLKVADLQRRIIIGILETAVKGLRGMTSQQYVDFFDDMMRIHFHARHLSACIPLPQVTRKDAV